MGIKPENYFILKDGTIIKNLFELSKQLDKMSEEVFSYHVNENRNDFYNWVKEVIKDRALARKISSVKERKKMQKYIGEKIQNDVVKEMDNKKQKKSRTSKKKTKTKRPKITEKHQGIFDKIFSSFFKTKERSKNHPYINSEEVKPGVSCPYKTIHCGIMEFLFGIAIGLLIALIINRVV